MELHQVLADQLGDVVGGYEAPPPVQQLGLQVAVLVHFPPDQHIVARVQWQLAFGVVILGLGKGLISIPVMQKN